MFIKQTQKPRFIRIKSKQRKEFLQRAFHFWKWPLLSPVCCIVVFKQKMSYFWSHIFIENVYYRTIPQRLSLEIMLNVIFWECQRVELPLSVRREQECSQRNSFMPLCKCIHLSETVLCWVVKVKNQWLFPVSAGENHYQCNSTLFQKDSWRVSSQNATTGLQFKFFMTEQLCFSVEPQRGHKEKKYMYRGMFNSTEHSQCYWVHTR